MSAKTEGETCGCCNCLDIGILVLRVGIGVFFLIHGIPKILAGAELWEKLGMAMGGLGIHFAPTFWGFMAAISEAGGGLFLILGLFIRPFAALLCFTMVVATVMLVNKDAGFAAISNPAHLIVVFVALLISGGGAWSLGNKIRCLRDHWYR